MINYGPGLSLFYVYRMTQAIYLCISLFILEWLLLQFMSAVLFWCRWEHLYSVVVVRGFFVRKGFQTILLPDTDERIWGTINCIYEDKTDRE